ncbi:MAG: hypothetical protein OXT03_06205, partial [Alphaproteobacteria bacterium]|nr:hypothetical protein [Alphaproteobacteria bacterium]
MVALISTYVRLNGRWLNYLLLSICVNALIAFSVNLGNATQAVPALPILKVNLMALPTHVSTLPVPTPETKHEKKPEIKHEKKQAQKIVTEKHAVAKLAAIQPLAKR